MSRLQSDHSLWSALIGWTACARRIVSPAASDRPRWRTLPAATSSAMAPTVSSMGTLGSAPCHTAEMELQRRTAELYMRHAFGQMLDVADRLGDERVNDRPLGAAKAAALPTAGAGARASESDRWPKTNAVAALIIHSCAVT